MTINKFLGTLFILLLSINSGFSQIKAQWRGDNRDGIYNEQQLLKSWPDSGPAMLWYIEDIGDGYGSPAVTNDKLFVNGWIDSISHVFAFDLKGKLLWKTANGKEFTGSGFSNKFAGSRSTPTVVGDLVYACSGNGRIVCLNANTGKEIWATDLIEKFNGIMPYFGYSESILVDGNKLYVFPGGTEKNAVALNRLTGETIWTSKAISDTVAYCSPILIKLPARNILMNVTTFSIIGLDADNGELLWPQQLETIKKKQTFNTPLFSDGYIYYLAEKGFVKLEPSANGKSIKEMWRTTNVNNGFNGFVKLNNHLFSTDRSQKLKCIDMNTGIVTDSLKITKGILIAANDMLYCYSDNGEVNLIKLTGTKMEIVSKFKVKMGTKEHFAHPVIKNGVLYIRHGKALMAFDIKEK
jgi:outer membrane protein assembly factor BamB